MPMSFSTPVVLVSSGSFYAVKRPFNSIWSTTTTIVWYYDQGKKRLMVYDDKSTASTSQTGNVVEYTGDPGTYATNNTILENPDTGVSYLLGYEGDLYLLNDAQSDADSGYSTDGWVVSQHLGSDIIVIATPSWTNNSSPSSIRTFDVSGDTVDLSSPIDVKTHTSGWSDLYHIYGISELGTTAYSMGYDHSIIYDIDTSTGSITETVSNTLSGTAGEWADGQYIIPWQGDENKFVYMYVDEGNSNYLSAAIVTRSGSTLTKGTGVVVSSGSYLNSSIYNSANYRWIDASTVVFTFVDYNNTLASKKLDVSGGAVSVSESASGPSIDTSGTGAQIGVTPASYADMGDGTIRATAIDDPNGDIVQTILDIGVEKFSLSGGTNVSASSDYSLAGKGIVTLGSPLQFDSDVSYIDSDFIDSNKVVISYDIPYYDEAISKTIHDQRARLITFNGTTPAVESATTFAAVLDYARAPTVRQIDSSSILYISVDASFTQLGTIGDVSGTSITDNVSYQVTSFTNRWRDKKLHVFNSTSALYVGWETMDGKSVKITFSGTSISHSDKVNFSTSYQPVTHAIDNFTDSVGILLWNDSDNGSYETCSIVDLSGVDPSFGLSYVLNSNSTKEADVKTIDETYALVAYINNADDKGYTRIVERSGSSIVSSSAATQISDTNEELRNIYLERFENNIFSCVYSGQNTSTSEYNIILKVLEVDASTGSIQELSKTVVDTSSSYFPELSTSKYSDSNLSVHYITDITNKYNNVVGASIDMGSEAEVFDLSGAINVESNSLQAFDNSITLSGDISSAASTSIKVGRIIESSGSVSLSGSSNTDVERIIHSSADMEISGNSTHDADISVTHSGSLDVSSTTGIIWGEEFSLSGSTSISGSGDVDISAEVGGISAGDPLSFDVGGIHVTSEYLDTNRIIIGYYDGAEKARVVSFTDTTPSFGAEETINTAGDRYTIIGKIDSSKALLVTEDPSHASIADISGTTISNNALQQVSGVWNHMVDPNVHVLDSTTALLVGSTATEGQAIKLSISGTTVSGSTPVLFSGDDILLSETGTDAIDSFDSSTAILVYGDKSNSEYGTAHIVDMSGATPSLGLPYVFESDKIWNSAAKPTVKVIDSTHALIYSYTSANRLSAVIVERSGSSIVSQSPRFQLSIDFSSFLSLERLQNDIFACTHRISDSNDAGDVVYSVVLKTLKVSSDRSSVEQLSSEVVSETTDYIRRTSLSKYSNTGLGVSYIREVSSSEQYIDVVGVNVKTEVPQWSVQLSGTANISGVEDFEFTPSFESALQGYLDGSTTQGVGSVIESDASLSLQGSEDVRTHGLIQSDADVDIQLSSESSREWLVSSQGSLSVDAAAENTFNIPIASALHVDINVSSKTNIQDWMIILDFNDGTGWHDYGDTIINEMKFDDRVLKNFKAGQRTVQVEFKKDPDLINRIAASTGLIDARVYKDGRMYFTGLVEPEKKFEVYEDVRGTSIDIIDYGVLLERKVIEERVWKDYKICDPSDTDHSIVHSLLTEAGVSHSFISPTILTLDTVIDVFYMKKKKKFFDLLDDLLYEYGYSFLFNQYGTLQIINTAPETVSVDHVFSNNVVSVDDINIIQPLQWKSEDEDALTARVEWRELQERPDTLLYRGLPDPEDHVVVPYGLYYPAAANVDEIYQEYRPVIPDMDSDDFELLYSTNHVLDYIVESPTIVVAYESYGPFQSRVYFENTGTENAELRWFDIRGDAVLEVNERTLSVDGWGAEQQFDTHRSKYIFNKQSATRLVNILHDRLQYSKWEYVFDSFDDVAQGSVVSLVDVKSGVNTTGIITRKTWSTTSPLFSYEVVGLTSYIERPISETQSITSRGSVFSEEASIRIERETSKKVSEAEGYLPQFISSREVAYIEGSTLDIYKKAYDRLSDGVKMVDGSLLHFDVSSDKKHMSLIRSGVDGIEDYYITGGTTTQLTSTSADKSEWIAESSSHVLYTDSGDSSLKIAPGDSVLLSSPITAFSTYYNSSTNSIHLLYASVDDGNTLQHVDLQSVDPSLFSPGSATAITTFPVDFVRHMNGTTFVRNTDDSFMYMIPEGGSPSSSGEQTFSVDVSDKSDVIASIDPSRLLYVFFNENTYTPQTITIPLEKKDIGFTGDLSNGSTRVESVEEDIILTARVGDTITGFGIQSGTVIEDIGSDYFDISKVATATLFDAPLYLNGEEFLVGTNTMIPGAVDTRTIANLAITETKISDAAISTPKLQANSVTANEIAAGSIVADSIDTNSIFTLNIRSDNYVEGSSGFDISRDGVAEFYDVFVRGRVEATEGYFSGILQGAGGEFSGNLAAATGTFVGQFETAAIKTEQGDETQYIDSFPAVSDQARDIWQGLNNYGLAGGYSDAPLVPCDGTYNGHTVKYIKAQYASYYCVKDTDGSGTSYPYYLVELFDASASTIERNGFSLNFSSCLNTGSGNVYTTIGYYRGSRKAQSSATLDITINTGGDKLFLLNTPLSSSGLEIGRVYSDGGTLKIVQ